MDLEEMDGFFSALICGPVTVPPSVYLDEIWGGEEAPFVGADHLDEFLNLAMRHWNHIVRMLASPDLVFLPWVEIEEGEEIPRGNRWAHGFMRGVNLCRESWDEIFEEDNKFAQLLPVLALAHEHDPDQEMRAWQSPPDRELRERVIAGLSVGTQWFHDYFRSQQLRAKPRDHHEARRAGRKIGRNEPCYCGSGKKYKKCCGNVTIN